MSLLRCCWSSWTEQEKRKMNCTDWDVVPWILRGDQDVVAVEYTHLLLSRKDKNSVSKTTCSCWFQLICMLYPPHYPMLLLLLYLVHTHYLLQYHCQMGRDVGEGWQAHHLLPKPFHYFISSLLVVVYNSSGKWMMMQLHTHFHLPYPFPDY